MDNQTRFNFAVAAAAFSFLFACHVADPNGKPAFPTDVQANTPNKGDIKLDIYARDAGQPTNGNDVTCVWTCDLREGSDEGTTHQFESCVYNETLSVEENTHKVDDQPDDVALARAKTAVASCNQEVMPPGEHSFRLRNLPLGFYLFNLNVVYTNRTVTVMHGGQTNWHDMCIAQSANACKATDTGGTETTTGNEGGQDDTGNDCDNACTNLQECVDGMCVNLPQVDLCDPVQYLGHHQMGSDLTEIYLPDVIGDKFGGKDCQYMDDKQESRLTFVFTYDGGPNAPAQPGITYDPNTLIVKCNAGLHNTEPGKEQGSQATFLVNHPLDPGGSPDQLEKFDCYGKPVDGGPNG